jgi:hypothetical protein
MKLSTKRRQAIYDAVSEIIGNARVQIRLQGNDHPQRMIRAVSVDVILKSTQWLASQAAVRAAEGEKRCEDRGILRGYNAILKGKKLIELSKVIAAGGADEKHRPRLAIMRADQRECYVRAERNGGVTFCDKDQFYGRHRNDLRIGFPEGTLPAWTVGAWSVEARGILPLIPPQHRPADDIASYHILWEAAWHEVPRDPALLKHLGGDLYAVVAIWDLTDLEMAVLSGRSRR